MSYDVVVIGGGNMGAALVGGVLASGSVDAATLAIVEASAARRDELAGRFPDVEISATVPECRSAILAVKPPQVPEVAAAAVAAGATRLLSIAAGVSIATIEAAAGESVAVLRSMPNTPALVGQGLAALAGGRHASPDDVHWAESVLGVVGTVVRIGEDKFDAVTGLTGSGPAYVFLIAEALMDAGVSVGLPWATSEAMVIQLLSGSAALLADQRDPAALRRMVTSPAGTTAAGVQVLEERGVRAALGDAVRAAAARSRALDTSN